MALVHFAPGVELNRAAESGAFTPSQIQQIGEITTRIHQATDGYQSQYHRYHQLLWGETPTNEYLEICV